MSYEYYNPLPVFEDFKIDAEYLDIDQQYVYFSLFKHSAITNTDYALNVKVNYQKNKSSTFNACFTMNVEDEVDVNFDYPIVNEMSIIEIYQDNGVHDSLEGSVCRLTEDQLQDLQDALENYCIELKLKELEEM